MQLPESGAARKTPRVSSRTDRKGFNASISPSIVSAAGVVRASAGADYPAVHMLSIVQNVCGRLENTCQLPVFPESVGTVKGPTELI